ncbi:hypothetical protein FQN54_005034 [Arachnomyces sp. PD_36]|nr:hypothetical protein FQN54_005034 [Arachnomyces sp. PD_36]
MAKSKQELPAWYYRIVALTMKEDRDVDPEDFDEDLSSISSVSVDSETDDDDEDSDSGSGSDSGDEDEDSEDAVSNESYNGSDADYYYELKEYRKERKLELHRTRKLDEQEKNSHRTFEQEKQKEVQEFYDSLKNAKKRRKTSLESIDGRFSLYSADHVDHFFHLGTYGSKWVEFYPEMRNPSDSEPPQSIRQDPRMTGFVDFALDAGCQLEPFSAPKYAGLEEFRLIDTDRKHELVFQILNNDYVKLKVPREVFFENGDPPANTPEVFEFWGIRDDWKKEMEAMEREIAERKRKRSPPSPKDNWFNNHHPMGYYNQSHWF